MRRGGQSTDAIVHACRDLWSIKVFASHQPAMQFVPRQVYSPPLTTSPHPWQVLARFDFILELCAAVRQSSENFWTGVASSEVPAAYRERVSAELENPSASALTAEPLAP
jgi:hypothetical protein